MFQFRRMRRNAAGWTRSDGSRVMCQRCAALNRNRRSKAHLEGEDIVTRRDAATWTADRVEADGRSTWVAYCDDHFHWWNERRLGFKTKAS